MDIISKSCCQIYTCTWNWLSWPLVGVYIHSLHYDMRIHSPQKVKNQLIFQNLYNNPEDSDNNLTQYNKR